MKLNKVREPCTGASVFKLIPLGDIHLGSSNCDKDLLAETIREIQGDPLARWIGMGDYAEWISPNDKRWDEGGVDGDIVTLGDIGHLGDIYTERLVELFKPIADKCWAFGVGNHEASFSKYNNTDLARRILQGIGKPGIYTGWATFTRAVFKSENSENMATWTIYHSHGWQAGRRPGAKSNQLELMAGYFEADIILQGHGHARKLDEFIRLGPTANFKKLRDRKILAAHTGSFLRTYQQDRVGYAETKGYPPVALGPIRILLRPGHGHLEKRAEGVL